MKLNFLKKLLFDGNIWPFRDTIYMVVVFAKILKIWRNSTAMPGPIQEVG